MARCLVVSLPVSLIVGMLTIGMLFPTRDGQANAAGTILLVSDSATDAKDAALITFLEGLGHTVDTSGMNQVMRDENGGPDLTAANAAELVILSRRTSSIEAEHIAGVGGATPGHSLAGVVSWVPGAIPTVLLCQASGPR